MQRRSFVLGAAAAGAAAVGMGGILWKWREVQPHVRAPGRAEGHFLRDLARNPGILPAPEQVLDTDIAILGSGIAGLTAAWKLERCGHQDFLVIDGPEADGNAAGAQYGEYACPTGAHYLPLPSQECPHVREILADLGVILRDAQAERPYYDERYLLHAPDERLLVAGHWVEGLLPPLQPGEQEQLERFNRSMDSLRNSRDAQGRRPFMLPSAQASDDPRWLALDRITMRQWLDQEGYRSPALHWLVNYGCRDDYGARYDQVSAWAGLHYFCSRIGQAANAGDGAWLTWPGGLQPLAAGLARRIGARRRAGTVLRLEETSQGVEALCMVLRDGKPTCFLLRARKAICAMPLFVAARVTPSLRALGIDPARHLPPRAPWLVANFLLKRFPAERPEAPLSWDNVVYREPGLGYVVSTHQDIRVHPPEKTVLTSYVALTHLVPEQARRWMDQASAEQLLALAMEDLQLAYGWNFGACVERVDLTLRAHAMAIPTPGFRSNAGLRRLQQAQGKILYAHSDLSGLSLFEEASWWGYQAALKALPT
ncbi:amine oxidase [Herbaspirillum rubrisubalbicans]|uniref:Amine oxidase n=1 Tax=Herbaspirillum rubrisubalbicans TaxID=80842 RepID=A0ABX9C2Z7_9BURK|nr:NAD(P)-binding protein [Herbaspirillum rubrisubalbicans]RAM64822.1 amine oxidase [Herbaspirillum rubrisubalbicans]RAN48215.1 amine oxidase [Herbaspirillum rubrisubalbicans]